MSSMSSAQIVSAGSAIHNKMPPALVGPLALHASTPVSYPGAVSRPPIFLFLSLYMRCISISYFGHCAAAAAVLSYIYTAAL